MPGDLRTCLRQSHQLPVSTLGYLPLWLDMLRIWLSADGVAALWCYEADAPCANGMSGESPDLTGAPGTTCWYAPQAPLSACERLAACGWTMPPVAALKRSLLSPDDMLCSHARGVRRHRDPASASLPRPPELDGCLSDGDLLDVCLLPVPRPADGWPPCSGAGTPAVSFGALRLLVSRDGARPRFNAREVAAFEAAAAEFARVPERPHFPPLAAATSLAPEAGQGVPGVAGADTFGTLIWHRRQPEWADPVALTLMRRVWRLVPGGTWHEACPVVQACQRLADELTRHPSGVTSTGVQVGTALPVPGGTLHLHATHLCAMGGSATDRVRIALHLVVPPAIRLLQRLSQTPLTPVQREIAMRLLAGQSRTQTREACAIGVQTLKTHLSLMRARLDPVRDASLLLGLGGGGAAVSASCV